jgi:hypothetical protein
MGMTDLLEAHTLLCLHCKAYGSYFSAVCKVLTEKWTLLHR